MCFTYLSMDVFIWLSIYLFPNLWLGYKLISVQSFSFSFSFYFFFLPPSSLLRHLSSPLLPRFSASHSVLSPILPPR